VEFYNLRALCDLKEVSRGTLSYTFLFFSQSNWTEDRKHYEVLGMPRVVDGSFLEGGGQILRYGAALSALTRQPLVVEKIRGGRKKPGLRRQHLVGLGLVRDVCKADATGLDLESERIELAPSDLKGGHLVGDAMGAGSCTLIAQAVLPCLLYAPLSVPNLHNLLTCRGGTDADFAPPIDFMRYVLVPTLNSILKNTNTSQAIKSVDLPKEMDGALSVNLKRRGFVPAGGGEIDIHIKPFPPGHGFFGFDFSERLDIVRITAHIFVTKTYDESVANNISKAISTTLAQKGVYCTIESSKKRNREDSKATLHGSTGEKPAMTVHVELEGGTAKSKCCGVLLIAETRSGRMLSASERVKGKGDGSLCGRTAAARLALELSHGGAVDCFLQDQLVLWMALAHGKSTITTGEITLHTKTAMWLCSEMTGATFHVTPGDLAKSVPNVITCTGSSFVYPSPVSGCSTSSVP